MSARFFPVISPAKSGRLGSFYFWEVDLWFLKCASVHFLPLFITFVTFGTLKVIEAFPDVPS